MATDGFSLTQTNKIRTESVEQDQTERIFRLILVYNIRKINPWWQTVGQVKSICTRPIK